jgi:hypothetical protein
VNIEPLWEIRLRTPRVELRLPTADELETLYDVAAAGIHPPEEMPFGVAWTDDLSTTPSSSSTKTHGATGHRPSGTVASSRFWTAR